MLKKITIKNISSIGECTIDFKKNKYAFLEENVQEDCVNPVVLYGHNGSGKTSLFRAIKGLILLLGYNVNALSPFPVNQFEFNKAGAKSKEAGIGSISLCFETLGHAYEYFLSTSRDNDIPLERLVCDASLLFEYQEGKLIYKGKPYPLGNNVSKLIPGLRVLAQREIDDEILVSAYSFLSQFAFVDLPMQNSQNGYIYSSTLGNLSTGELLFSKSKEVKEILRGYDDFPLYSIQKNEASPSALSSSPQYSLCFEGMEGESLPLSLMSEGMKNSSLMLSLLLSLKEGSCLFVDELDLALHPSAIRSFLDEVRKKKVQLLFSSHNTNVLQTLRPDQVYFAKWEKGYSSCHRLSDIYPNIRQINNIEKMYLGNVFEIGGKE